MKKIITILIFFISFNIFSVNLPKDIEIINMPLYDVLAILSKETGKNIISSKEAKDIIIDAYFEKGENINDVLLTLIEAYNLSFYKTNNATIVSLKTENKQNKSKIIFQILDSSTGEPLSKAKIEINSKPQKINITNNNGISIIENIHKDSYIIKISKENFVDKFDIIDISKSINNFTIYLKPNQNKNETESYLNKNLNFFETDGKILYTESFSLFNISPIEIKKILNESFGENLKVSTLTNTNKIVIIAERDILESAKNLIKDLDSRTKQVRITSEILDISNNLFEELGFDWVYNQSHIPSGKSNSLNASLLNSAASVSTGNVFGSSFSLLRQFSKSTDVLNLGINLLEASNELTVSSVPTITITSGEEGEFKVTEEVVVGEKRKKVNNDDEKATHVEPIFKEAGLILKVKPYIKDDDYIDLEIHIELSNFKFKKNLLNLNEINSGTFNSDGGSKVGRILSTKVRVKNGDTILLGGLKKSIKQNVESKIPFLGDIPIINFFFKNVSKKNENSDMYIKLKVDIEK